MTNTHPRLFMYRNCFTGDVSGGDMHSSGVNEWLLTAQPATELFLVAANNDGQEIAYPDVARITRLGYWAPKFGVPAISFMVRAWLSSFVKLPWSHEQNIIVASSHFLPDVWPAFFKRAKRLTRVVYIHHIVQDMPRQSGLNTTLANLQEKLCFWLIKKRFDKIIVVNKEVEQRLRQLGFAKQAILVSSNFVTPPDSPEQSWPLALPKKDITLVMCGRLVPQKGVDDFLAVCEFLQSRVPNFSAVMVGAGPEESRLKREVRQRGLQVRVAGYVSLREKFDMVSRAQLFVFPSIEEGWGIVIAEALTMGTPVLAYDLPVYKQIFGGQLHTVPLGKRQALAEEALRLLQAYHKKQVGYKTKQQEITEFAKRFSLDDVSSAEYRFMTEEV